MNETITVYIFPEHYFSRKRYEKAEAEFVKSKVNLHKKTITKDELTEHLCSIIQESEERKAKKLAELMVKLEIADQDLNEAETLYESEEKEKETQLKELATQCEPVPKITGLAPNSQQVENQTLPVNVTEIVDKDSSNNNEKEKEIT